VSRTFSVTFQLVLVISSLALDTIIHGQGLRLVIARVCVCVRVLQWTLSSTSP